MRVFWHKKEGNKQLLLIFNGWGFDEKIFRGIDFSGHDIVSVCDYSCIEPESLIFTELYSEVKLLAWSYGVFIADLYAGNIRNLKRAIAVNGSVSPINDTKGIPEKIFLATMQAFNEKNRDKFYLRITGGATAYKNLANRLPDRTSDNQLAELKALYELSSKERDKGLSWDMAIISENDKIFPAANLKNAWTEQNIPVQIINAEHIPFFENSFIDIVDKIFETRLHFSSTVKNGLEQRIRQKFGKSMDTYDQSAYAQKEIAEKLFSLISNYRQNTVKRIFEIGCGTGFLTKMLIPAFAGAKFYLNDLNEKVGKITELFSENNCEFLAGDAQIIDYPDNMDLIVSSSTIQWFDNLLTFSKKSAKALSAGGYMFLSGFGKNNLKEIREITGTGLEYPSLTDMKNIFSAEFEILHISEEEISPSFDSPTEVLVHLRNTGVNANCTGQFKTRKKLDLFCEEYQKLFLNESQVKLTYNPVYLALKKKL